MAQESAEIREVRPRLIALLEADDIDISREVEREARKTLGCHRECKSQYAIIEFIVILLKDNFPMYAIDLTDPKYRPARGYVMKKPHGWDIYVKLRITDSITEPRVHIMSFHPEIH